MTRCREHRGLVGLVAGAASAACLVGGGIAVAAIPSTATGNFTGCVLKTSGATRIIDYQAGKRCKATENTVNWAQRGPQGVPGPAGRISGYDVLTEHVDIQPQPAGSNLEFGTSIGAPIGKVILSGGFYFDNGAAPGNPPPQIASEFVNPGGTTYTWVFICHNAVPCPIDKYIVVADAP